MSRGHQEKHPDDMVLAKCRTNLKYRDYCQSCHSTPVGPRNEWKLWHFVTQGTICGRGCFKVLCTPWSRPEGLKAEASNVTLWHDILTGPLKSTRSESSQISIQTIFANFYPVSGDCILLKNLKKKELSKQTWGIWRKKVSIFYHEGSCIDDHGVQLISGVLLSMTPPSSWLSVQRWVQPRQYLDT